MSTLSLTDIIAFFRAYIKMFVFKGSPVTAADFGSCFLPSFQTGATSAAVKGDLLKTNAFNMPFH